MSELWNEGPIPEDGKYLLRISPAAREAFGLSDADLPNIIVDAKAGQSPASEALSSVLGTTPMQWSGPIEIPEGIDA